MNANKPSTRGAKVNAEKTEVVQTSRRGRGAPGQAKIQQVNGGPRGRGGGAAATVPPVKDSKVDVAVSADASKQKSLNRETKSLQKLSAALERSKRLFVDQMAASKDRLRAAHVEITTSLEDRRRKLEEELEKCEQEGTEFLTSRSNKINELKALCNKAEALSDKALVQFREDIRKLELEQRAESKLATGIRFEWEPDQLLSLTKSFGNVPPLFSNRPSIPPTPAVQVNGSSHQESKSSKLHEISLGGIAMQSDSLDAKQLLELTRHIQLTLRRRGIPDDILPKVSGEHGVLPTRRTRGTAGAGRGRRGRGGGTSGRGSEQA
ncbi:hypothetical protein M514_02841 [Trichuris suis]|uniref:Uncharacterized protein n=1 Tax=Trichuris suis TaxID=68888 RepID=A0A085NEQ5_9BILA|nr:hypothetical protein M513_02841 [Trichuris suis]KFD67951.1 hypothetical protein M514_02841 [Trichuris suis]